MERRHSNDETGGAYPGSTRHIPRYTPAPARRAARGYTRYREPSYGTIRILLVIVCVIGICMPIATTCTVMFCCRRESLPR